jgi:hypothetical protein
MYTVAVYLMRSMQNAAAYLRCQSREAGPVDSHRRLKLMMTEDSWSDDGVLRHQRTNDLKNFDGIVDNSRQMSAAADCSGTFDCRSQLDPCKS